MRSFSVRTAPTITVCAASPNPVSCSTSARAVGARPILVRTGKGAETEARGEGLAGVAIYDELAVAVDALLGEQHTMPAGCCTWCRFAQTKAPRRRAVLRGALRCSYWAW